MKDQKKKFKEQFHLPSQNKPTKGDKNLYCENYKDTDERNQRRQKQMKRYTMFMDWNNQYCQNDYTTQCKVQIQYNLYQITNTMFFSQN